MEILAVMETCFWGTLGESKLKYLMILIWLLCMWIQFKNILPSNYLIDIKMYHIMPNCERFPMFYALIWFTEDEIMEVYGQSSIIIVVSILWIRKSLRQLFYFIDNILIWEMKLGYWWLKTPLTVKLHPPFHHWWWRKW